MLCSLLRTLIMSRISAAMLRELAEALSKYYAPEAEIYVQHQRNIGWMIMQRRRAGAISHGSGLTATETRQWLRGALAVWEGK